MLTYVELRSNILPMRPITLSIDEKSKILLDKAKTEGIPYSASIRMALAAWNTKKIESPTRAEWNIPSSMIPPTPIDVPMPGKLIQNRAMILLKRIEDPNDEVSENDIALFLKQLI